MGGDKAISKYIDLNNSLHENKQQILQRDEQTTLEALEFCEDFTGYTIQLKIQEEKVKFSEPPKVDTSKLDSEISSLKVQLQKLENENKTLVSNISNLTSEKQEL